MDRWSNTENSKRKQDSREMKKKREEEAGKMEDEREV